MHTAVAPQAHISIRVAFSQQVSYFEINLIILCPYGIARDFASSAISNNQYLAHSCTPTA